MASIFFVDYNFPSEVYNRDTNDFSTPIRTLLDFTPHILRELPKDPKDQEPIQPTKDRSFEFMSETKQTKEKATNYVQYAQGFAQFLADCCVEYAIATSRHDREAPKAQQQQQQQHQQQAKPQPRTTATAAASSKEDEKANDEQKKEQKGVSTAAKSAAAIGALTFSLYSTYQASVTWGDVTLQNQVELLLEHVEAQLSSARIWTEERTKMDDHVPELIVEDLKRLGKLVDCLYRLDSRREKKIETAGWGVGIVGGLSVLGGIAVGSAAILTGGAAAALGAVLVAVATRGSKQATQNIRMLVEAQVHTLLNELERDKASRRAMLTAMTEKSNEEAFEFVPRPSATRVPGERIVVDTI
ncbi:hypothetical protein BJV82DRAFT_626987 [Fennellomyces sp. T-0311]|nr:hypothetical protein BJV82DRAFT_626987 [Fennellomyces sp. T-0311]